MIMSSSVKDRGRAAANFVWGRTAMTTLISTSGPLEPPNPPLLTAEEFIRLYPDHNVELVNGVVRELPMPGFKHGKFCVRITTRLGTYLDANDIGTLVSHDTFVKVRSNPDVVLGPDVAYFSYERLPKDQQPEVMADVSPELVVEVRSPSDLWTEMFTKVGQYLNAGISVVVVIDSDTRTASVYRPDGSQVVLATTDTLTIPDILPGFAVEIARLFE